MRERGSEVSYRDRPFGIGRQPASMTKRPPILFSECQPHRSKSCIARPAMTRACDQTIEINGGARGPKVCAVFSSVFIYFSMRNFNIVSISQKVYVLCPSIGGWDHLIREDYIRSLGRVCQFPNLEEAWVLET